MLIGINDLEKVTEVKTVQVVVLGGIEEGIVKTGGRQLLGKDASFGCAMFVWRDNKQTEPLVGYNHATHRRVKP